jgi:hypothetical protein
MNLLKLATERSDVAEVTHDRVLKER